jgi:uncharacterized protein (DUF697 family)
MKLSDLRALALEGQAAVATARDELPPPVVGSVVVSGMLAEQLARELAAGAEPGAVTVGDGSPVSGAEVYVHVIAGDPSEADDALARGAERRGAPVVLVQLWPQEDWTPPFVLSPFVVECRTGEGFPVGIIAGRIAEGVAYPAALASRVPALRDAVSDVVTREAVVRAGFLGAAGDRKGASRPLIATEQIRMLARLRAMTTRSAASEETRVVAAGAALALATGFALRGAARRAGRVLPASIVNPVVAAAGTWALARALQTLESRIPST